jgi:RimJ/RimL family protein N-acetyltransferase
VDIGSRTVDRSLLRLRLESLRGNGRLGRSTGERVFHPSVADAPQSTRRQHRSGVPDLWVPVPGGGDELGASCSVVMDLVLVGLTAATLDAELAGDWTMLSELLHASIQEWPPEGGEWDRAAMEFFRQQLDTGVFDVGWAPSYVVGDGRLVAGAGFFGPPDGDGEVEIGYSVCRSERRRGVATAIVGQLCDLARQAGCVSVRARTTPDNVASVATLARNGFRESERSLAGDGIVTVVLRHFCL